MLADELFCNPITNCEACPGMAVALLGINVKLNGNATGEVSTVSRLARSSLSCVSDAPIFEQVAAEIADASD